MTKDRLEQLLRDRIGLAADSIGRLALQHAVETRRQAIGAADVASYVEIAASSVAEWDELVELLVVPETWFFRGSATYEFLGSFAREARHRWNPGMPLRILSAPCSTGEEPYSIVMALLAEGWPLEALQVEGIDLSRRALSTAATAAYSGRAFRETTPLASTCRTRHFRSDGTREWLEPRIRDVVRWRQANLMNPIFLPDSAPFDIVFCRNVLIYLHDEARQRVRDHLHRVLRPGGLLFLGHADPLGREETRFESLAPTAAFVFRRRETISSAPPPPHLARPAARPANHLTDQLAALLKGAVDTPSARRGPAMDTSESNAGPRTANAIASPTSGPASSAPRKPVSPSPSSAWPLSSSASTPPSSTLPPLSLPSSVPLPSKRAGDGALSGTAGAGIAGAGIAGTGTANTATRNSATGNTATGGLGDDRLVEAKRAADRGDMKAAESHCREQLRHGAASAATYCLLGVVLQATGRVDEARSQFERALYLDPEHLEALTHMMLAARHAGELADADRYQRRVEKAQRRAAESPASGRAAEGGSR